MDSPIPTLPPAEEASPRRNPLIPDDQDQKAALAEFLAAAWANNPQLVLIWMMQADFAVKATAYAAAVRARNQAGALVPQQTLSFEQYDEQIRIGIKQVKNYLSELFGEDDAKKYYLEFGIQTRGEVYELPRAQKERADALDDLVAALANHGLGARPHGTAYWQPIADGYGTLTGKARTTAANISKLVGVKNDQEEEIDEVLSAMISLIDAQYRTPAARQAKLRELGFQREYS